jgi:hypothetical protein
MDPCFIDLGTSWSWLASRPCRFNLGGKSPRYSLGRRLSGPQSRSGHEEATSIYVEDCDMPCHLLADSAVSVHASCQVVPQSYSPRSRSSWCGSDVTLLQFDVEACTEGNKRLRDSVGSPENTGHWAASWFVSLRGRHTLPRVSGGGCSKISEEHNTNLWQEKRKETIWKM